MLAKMPEPKDHGSPGKNTQAIRKPQKPAMISIIPTSVAGSEWPGIALAEPSGLNLPIRAPRLIRTPRVKKPAIA